MKAIVRHTASTETRDTRWYNIADSAILFSPRPYFLPEWLENPTVTAALAVRISRLGKTIEPRFASRYFDAATIALLPHSGQRLHDDNALTDSADGALILGSMIPIEQIGDSPEISISDSDGIWAETALSHWRNLAEEAIAEASLTLTWKTGDLLCITLPMNNPIGINHRIRAELNHKETISVNIK